MAVEIVDISKLIEELGTDKYQEFVFPDDPKITQENITLLCQALAKNTSVKRLVIPTAHKEVMKILFDCLSANRGIEALEVSRIADQDTAKALGRFLAFHPTLVKLKLSHVSVENQIPFWILDGCSKRKILRELCLDNWGRLPDLDNEYMVHQDNHETVAGPLSTLFMEGGPFPTILQLTRIGLTSVGLQLILNNMEFCLKQSLKQSKPLQSQGSHPQLKAADKAKPSKPVKASKPSKDSQSVEKDKDLKHAKDSPPEQIEYPLLELRLDNNPIGDIKPLTDKVLKGCKSLRVLSLRSCNLYGESASAVMQALDNHTQLKVLDLSSCGVGLGGVFVNGAPTYVKFIEALAKFIEKTSSLEELNLANCQLTSTSQNYLENRLLKMIFGAMRKNRTIKKLDLSEAVNENLGFIPMEAVQELAHLLQESRVLESLDITNLKLWGPLGLRHHAVLKDGAGAQLFAQALSQNMGLRRLALGGGQIYDADGEELLTAIQANNWLEQLLLSVHFTMGYHNRETMRRRIEINANLHTVSIHVGLTQVSKFNQAVSHSIKFLEQDAWLEVIEKSFLALGLHAPGVFNRRGLVAAYLCEPLKPYDVKQDAEKKLWYEAATVIDQAKMLEVAARYVERRAAQMTARLALEAREQARVAPLLLSGGFERKKDAELLELDDDELDPELQAVALAAARAQKGAAQNGAAQYVDQKDAPAAGPKPAAKPGKPKPEPKPKKPKAEKPDKPPKPPKPPKPGGGGKPSKKWA